MKKTSFKNFMRRAILFFIFIYAFYLISLGFIVWEIYSYEKSATIIRENFNKINDVIALRKSPDILIPLMEKYGYDYEKFGEYIAEYYKPEEKLNEKITAEVRNFANFLRKVQDEQLTAFKKRARTILVLFSIFFITIVIIGRKNTKTMINYEEKVLSTTKAICENLYTAEIEPLSEVFAEDAEVNKSLANINKVHKINELILHTPTTTSIEDFVYSVGPLLCELFHSNRFSVAIIDWESQVITAEVAYTKNPNHNVKLGPGFSQSFADTSLFEMIKENRLVRVINNLEEVLLKKNSIATKLIVEEGERSSMTLLATVNTRPFGFLFLSSERPNNFTERDEKLFASISTPISHRLYYSLTIQKVLSEFGNSLVNLVEFKDNETGNHVKRVAWYSKIISTQMELQPKIIREIYEYSPLHDIGKVSIPDNILLKPGKLDPSEWEIMKTHVINGVKIIENFEKSVSGIFNQSSLTTVKNIIADHHEWWNGNGYPLGKKGTEISIEGRIVAVADAFDALTTKRPYKEALPFEIAIEIIKNESGVHFDPDVVEAFLRSIEKIREIYNALKD